MNKILFREFEEEQFYISNKKGKNEQKQKKTCESKAIKRMMNNG